MAQLVIALFLVLTGALIGIKRKESLLYILLVLFPLFGVGTIKGINLTFSDLAVFLCAVPQVFFIMTRLIGRQRHLPHFTGLIVLLIGFTLYLFERCLASVHPDRLYFFKCLLFAMIIFVYALIYGKEMKPQVLTCITGIIISLESITALLQMTNGFEISQVLGFIDSSGVNAFFAAGMGFARGTGTFPDPNYFALYMGVLTSSLLPVTRRFLMKVFYFMGIAGILFSFSRMGVLICCLLFVMYFWKNVRLHSAGQVCAICFGLTGLIIAGSWFAANYAEIPMASAMVERFRYNEGNIGDAKGTRDYILKFYYHHLTERPDPSELAIGLGLDNFEYLLDAKTGIFLVAHNEYLQILADIGLLGYAFLMAIAFYLMRKSRLKPAGVNPFAGPILVMLFGFFFLTCTYELYCYFYLALFFSYRIFQEPPFKNCHERSSPNDAKGCAIGYQSLHLGPPGGVLRQNIGRNGISG